MNILMITINDPAGVAIAFAKAINQYTEHTCRLITKESRYNHLFEKDLHIPKFTKEDWDEVEHLLKTADIFHFHMTADESMQIGPFEVKNFIKSKSIVHHHHGHPEFRDNPEKYRQKYKNLRRRNLLVSTPDLLKLLPEATWQPNLVPINNPLYLPREDKLEKPLIVCQSPTRKDLKNTAELVRAVNDIKKASKMPIELRLIENTPHKKCLRLKRESHILFDHLQGYFGVSSLEGLSQGLCVIAGLDEWNQSHIKAFTGSASLPWIAATPHQLEEQLRPLVCDIDFVREKGIEAREFMENYWNDKRICTFLIETYR